MLRFLFKIKSKFAYRKNEIYTLPIYYSDVRKRVVGREWNCQREHDELSGSFVTRSVEHIQRTRSLLYTFVFFVFTFSEGTTLLNELSRQSLEPTQLS